MREWSAIIRASKEADELQALRNKDGRVLTLWINIGEVAGVVRNGKFALHTEETATMHTQESVDHRIALLWNQM